MSKYFGRSAKEMVAPIQARIKEKIMLEKLEKLLDVLTDAAVEARNYYARQNGADLPLEKKEAVESAAAKPRGRKPKVAAAEPPVESVPAAFRDVPNESGFPDLAAPQMAAVGPAASVEDQLEAKRRFMELGGAFIKDARHRTVQQGQLAFKAILSEVCGRPVAKIEGLGHADHLKMVARLEAEMATGAVA